MEWVKFVLDFLARISWPLAAVIISYWLLFKKGVILQSFLSRTKKLSTPFGTFEQDIMERLGDEAAEAGIKQSEATGENKQYTPEEIKKLLKDTYKTGAISANLLSGRASVRDVVLSPTTPVLYRPFFTNHFEDIDSNIRNTSSPIKIDWEGALKKSTEKSGTENVPKDVDKDD